MYDQLNMQLDLLQQRNEELEKEIIQSNALNIQEGKNVGCDDHSGNQNDVDNMQQIPNRKLLDRIAELVNREKCLLDELHQANCRLNQRDNDCIPTITVSLEREINALQQHVKSLECDRNYWKDEAALFMQGSRKESERRLSQNNDHESVDRRESILNRYSSEETNEDIIDSNREVDSLKRELKHCRHKLADITGENNELKQLLDGQDRNLSPPVKDKDHLRQYEAELKKVRMERDSLQDLLDKFERQLHDIQGNIRVLTQERDMINERYEECQQELHKMREIIIQTEKPRLSLIHI